MAIGLAAGLGYWAPEKPWWWGLAVMLAQAVVLVIVGSDYSLMPLGVILFSILALPTIGLAQFMAKIRVRSEKSGWRLSRSTRLNSERNFMHLEQMSDNQILGIANPIMDNLMDASTVIDHERHVQDFTDRLKKIVTPDYLLRVCR